MLWSALTIHLFVVVAAGTCRRLGVGHNASLMAADHMLQAGSPRVLKGRVKGRVQLASDGKCSLWVPKLFLHPEGASTIMIGMGAGREIYSLEEGGHLGSGVRATEVHPPG